MQVYEPHEDSFLIANVLKKYFNSLKNTSSLSYCDMGCGSAILAKTAKDCGVKNILCVDINPDAIKAATEYGFENVLSDLFSNVNGELMFETISFNAPYLPRDDREPEDSQVATTGGKRGDEISVRFLGEAMNRLNKNGVIFLLVSSLTPMNNINKFNPIEIARKRVGMGEDVIVYKIVKEYV
jgi:HemK-related putative methylase